MDNDTIDLRPALLFDLDGTLVDSVYQHVLAWREALESFGIELSVWRIHRRIGMSGGLFINALLRETGGQFDAERAALNRSGRVVSSTSARLCALHFRMNSPVPRARNDVPNTRRPGRWHQQSGGQPQRRDMV